MTDRTRIAVGQVYEFAGELAVSGTFEVVGIYIEPDGEACMVVFRGERAGKADEWPFRASGPFVDDEEFSGQYRLVAEPVAA